MSFRYWLVLFQGINICASLCISLCSNTCVCAEPKACALRCCGFLLYGNSGWGANRCSLQYLFRPKSGCSTSEKGSVCSVCVGGLLCQSVLISVYSPPPNI